MKRTLSLLILVLIPLSGCAKATYKVKDVSDEEKEWRQCSERLDGTEKAGKGWCYISQKCWNPWWGKERCKPIPLFCSWGDLPCYKKYSLDQKVLVHPKNTL